MDGGGFSQHTAFLLHVSLSHGSFLLESKCFIYTSRLACSFSFLGNLRSEQAASMGFAAVLTARLSRSKPTSFLRVCLAPSRPVVCSVGFCVCRTPLTPICLHTSEPCISLCFSCLLRREGERQRRSSIQLFLKCNSWSCTRLKPGAQYSSWVSHMGGRDAGSLASLCCLPGCP